MEFKNALIITSLAGLSTLLGALIIFIKNNERIINKALSFAVGVMITISIVDLLPESYVNLNSVNNTITTVLYMFISFVIAFILTSLIEDKIKIENDHTNMYKVGVVSMIGIILHNIPEGIITFITSSINIKLGISLAIAISLHNIPEGISIALPIYYSTKNKAKSLLYTLLSGFSEVVGGVIGYFLLSKFLNPTIMGITYSAIAGIMIYIAIFTIVPTVNKLNKKFENKIFILIGIIFMYIVTRII